MKVSVNWLKQYIDIDVTSEELAEALTLAGLEVEEIEHTGAQFTGVVVGHVVSAERHPNADKLTLCRVDVGGEETLSIVCGAPNVRADILVPVATVGAELAGGFKIKPVKLRGVDSHGMICSERELGLSDSHEGIMILDGSEFQKGESFAAEAAEPDTIFEIAITPNRPDCLSHLGVARDAAAIFKKNLKKPVVVCDENESRVESLVSVEIANPESCPRYAARVVENVKIGPSPDWLRQRLESIGLRSINNVVDITNFVLHECGHPLHAFDYDEVADHKIVVRHAEEGEIFTTLDDQKRTLKATDLLICDGKRAVALAGVMGGLNSEVTDKTCNILLESAYFDPMTVRKTAKRLGMHTDASQRFERGADPNGVIYAVDRAAQLMAELAGGSIAKGIVDANPRPIEPMNITVRPQRVNHVLGADFTTDIMKDVFTRLQLEVTGDDPMIVTVPTYRPDLTREIDMIEEVIRLHGFHNIVARKHTTMPLSDNRNEAVDFLESLRDFMSGQGFMECVHSSMVPEWMTDSSKHRKAIGIKNPLSPDTAWLRTSVLPSLLSAVVWNQNRSQSSLKLYEIGKQFFENPKGYRENAMLSVVLTGFDNRGPYWSDQKNTWGFFSIKGVLNALEKKLHIELTLKNLTHTLFDEHQSAAIAIGNKSIGHIGLISKAACKKWGIEKDVFAFEIDVDAIRGLKPSRVAFTEIPKFPAVKRDLAFVVDEDVAVGDIEKTIREMGGASLTAVDLFDIYRGDQIPPAKKSVAFALTFLSLERTLTDKEIDPVIAKVVKGVQKQFKAELRS